MPLYDEDGQIVAVLGLARDVTEREQAQAALEQANARLEARVAERTLDLQRVIEQLEHEILERQQAETLLRHSEAQLRRQTHDLEQALRSLQHTQTKLVQSKKMSSLGQLVAGVAHEINILSASSTAI